MKKKNRVWMGLNENQIDIQIHATSPEQARKMYEYIERSLIAAMKIDLEIEWQNSQEET